MQSYPDIVSKLGQPLWYDEAGCPRYAPFKPRLCNNIYAHEAALVEIACQECGQRFQVAISRDSLDTWRIWASIATDQSLHYGDPPCFDCVAGATMNCIDLRVLEYWYRDAETGYDWVRDEKFEIVLEEPDDQN